MVEGETSRSHEIDEEGFHDKLCVSDTSGQPDERNSSTAHPVKEQHAPDKHGEIALFNTDNEFKRAINEENIDFNIPGLPHSTVKQLHGASVRELIQKIDLIDVHFKVIFNNIDNSIPSAKNQKK